MTDVARLLLEGIDEDAVEFKPTYDNSGKEPVGSAGRLPEPARQRLAGHRGRHGDLDPAAQRRRALRRRAASDRQARSEVEVAAEMGQGPGLPDRRHHRRFQGERSRRPMSPAAARSAPARAGCRKRARAAPGSSSSPKFPGWCRSRGWSRRSPSCSNEKKLPLVGDVRDESAEDVRLVIEPKSRTVDPELLMESLFRLTELESRIPLNLNVLMKGKVPKVRGPCRVPARMARPSARRADPPHQLPQGADRASAGNARRLSDRLSEHRQGDQDHPHRGRAEAGADEDLQAHGHPGRLHPQHAPAQRCASSRKWRSAPRTRTSAAS